MRSILATIAFVIVTIIFSIVSVPAAVIDRSGRSYLWLARTWSKIFLWLYGIHIYVHGLKNLSLNKNYVYIANHSSYTDIPVLLAAIPDNIRLILRHSLTRVPIWGWALLVSPFLIIDRSSASKAKQTIDKAISTIRNGASVILFPEGTRTSDGNIQSFKRGAFKLAYDSATPIIPIALRGTFDVLPRQEKLPRTNKTVTVNIGAPLTVDQTIVGDRQRELDLMARAETAVRALLDNPAVEVSQF